jgi:hypothetical protein
MLHGNIQDGTGDQDQGKEEAAIHLISPCFRARFKTVEHAGVPGRIPHAGARWRRVYKSSGGDIECPNISWTARKGASLFTCCQAVSQRAGLMRSMPASRAYDFKISQNLLARQSHTVMVENTALRCLAHHSGTALLQIGCQSFMGVDAKGDLTLLPPLTQRTTAVVKSMGPDPS